MDRDEVLIEVVRDNAAAQRQLATAIHEWRGDERVRVAQDTERAWLQRVIVALLVALTGVSAHGAGVV